MKIKIVIGVVAILVLMIGAPSVYADSKCLPRAVTFRTLKTHRQLIRRDSNTIKMRDLSIYYNQERVSHFIQRNSIKGLLMDSATEI